MYDFIPSKCVREHFEKSGVALSEYEQAYIEFKFCRKIPTLEDRVSGFRRLAAETRDEDLRAELSGMLSDFDALWNDFITNDGSFVYISSGTLFFKYEDALKNALDPRQGWRTVSKIKLENGGEYVFTAYFYDNGERKEFYAHQRKGDPLGFKKKAAVPDMPFKCGDFVMSLRTGEILVVEECLNDDKNIGVRTLSVAYDGKLKSAVRNGFWLEKLDGFDRKGSSEELLCTARRCLLGEESLAQLNRWNELNYNDTDYRVYAEGYEHEC